MNIENVINIEADASEAKEGLSAYEVYLKNGGTLSEEEWLESLKGDTGLTGANGKDGKSAYESWLDAGNTGTEEDFINSLKGEKGDSSSISEIIEDTDMTIKDSGIYRVLASDQVSLRIGATSNTVAKYYQPGDYLFWNKEDSYLITLNKTYSSIL